MTNDGTGTAVGCWTLDALAQRGLSRVIFVLGSQRSGTTLLAQMLGAHRQAVLLDEPDGVHQWAEAAFRAGEHRKARRLFRRCCRRARRHYRVPGARVRIDGRLRDGIRYVVAKTPNLTFAHEALGRSFPGAHFVFLARDVRAVVTSIRRLDPSIVEKQTQRILRAPHLLRDFPDETRQLASHLVPSYLKAALVARLKIFCFEYFRDAHLSAHRVGYEELVTNSEATIRGLLVRLGIPFDPLCLEHQRVLCGSGPGRTDRGRAVSPGALSTWRSELTEREEAGIWALVGPAFESLGYSRAGNTPKPSQ